MSRQRSGNLSRAASALVAIGLLMVGDRLLQPVPIPAATAVFGGCLMVWLGHRKVWVAAGALGGTLIGVAIHAAVHVSGGSTLPPEGVPFHVTADGVRGFGVAAIVILVVILVHSLVGRVAKFRGDVGDGDSMGQ